MTMAVLAAYDIKKGDLAYGSELEKDRRNNDYEQPTIMTERMNKE